ncbi:MAG: ribonuclease J [Clostridiales Family XIII bacterium]|jgi:ribonuclease J|nr:ribonuclease J [Clostridiales Family XIII bacterium]
MTQTTNNPGGAAASASTNTASRRRRPRGNSVKAIVGAAGSPKAPDHRDLRTNKPAPTVIPTTTKQTAKPTTKSNTRPQTNRPPKKEHKSKSPAGALKVIPLGGLHEIGKNITAFEYNNEILVVDCGMSFPEDDMFGIDVVIPDFDYLVKNKQKVKGVIITHGHEDHIGGIPYLLKRMNVPVYATPLTLGLLKNKIKEHGLQGDFRTIHSGDLLRIGPFKIECIRTTHSIADALAFAIETPVGTVFHTGDFKVDYTPVDGEPIDFQKLAAIGSKGVILMMSDSTNALREGSTKSEQSIENVMEKIFDNTDSRIIVATFASNVHRIQTIINTAVRHGRKVALSGRSMLNILDIAMELGYIKIPKSSLMDLKDTRNIPDSKLCIITTGSQGEPMSALARMANNEHRDIRIKKGDKIVLSSSPIPGNEKSVSSIVNKLFEEGADVVYSEIADIHVSGHAQSDELRLLQMLIRPKFFMPVHGEYRHLKQHAHIAETLGTPKQNIFIMENGDMLEIKDGKAVNHKEKVPAEPVFVDGLGVGDISAIVLRDRKLLSESGLLILVATIDSKTGKVVEGPDIISRGFVYVKENEDMIADLREIAKKKLKELEHANKKDWATLKAAVRDELRRSIYGKTKRNPVILPIFMEA